MPSHNVYTSRGYVAKPKRRKRVTTTRSMARRGKGFSLGVPGVGQFLSANWKRPRPRASRYLNKYRPSSKASRVMSRSLQYGQSFNTGAMAQGLDDGLVCLKHREFLGVINSSVDFTKNVYEINPGLSRLCPWASSICNNFQQYKVRAMSFEFISTSATALSTGTNNALGQVAIATQYDSIAPEFRNLNDMLNSQYATSTKISSDLVHPIESEKNQTPTINLYTRPGRAPGDIRLYDLGRTTVAVYGCQSNGNQIGQLWVSYDIELYKPITYNLDGGNIDSAFITAFSTAGQGFSSSPLNPLGGSYFSNYDSIGVILDQTPGAQRIVLDAGSSGYYRITFAYFSNVAYNPALFWNFPAGLFSTTNADIQSSFYNYAGSSVAGSGTSPGQQTGTNACFEIIVNVADPSIPAVIAFQSVAGFQIQPMTSGGAGPGVSCLNIEIDQLNVGMDNFLVQGEGCCDQITQLKQQLTLLQERVLELEDEEDESDDSSSDSVDVVINNIQQAGLISEATIGGTGPTGPSGPTGPVGPTGPTGPEPTTTILI